MRRRRFALLATVLVALNLALWLAPQGLALRQAFIDQLFGPRLIRAEVVVQAGGSATQDYLIDRGVIASTSATSIVLREQDGTMETIPVDGATTRVAGAFRFGSVAQLRRGLRVLTVRLANGPAEMIQVEGRGALP